MFRRSTVRLKAFAVAPRLPSTCPPCKSNIHDVLLRRRAAKRYGNRARYQELVTGAASTLAEDRYLLYEDVPAIVERALANWDEITRGTSLAAK